MISTSTTLSNTVGGAIPINEYAEMVQPVKTPSVFSNQKGSDSFLPGRTMISSAVDSFELNTIGQGEFTNIQTGSTLNTGGAPTFIVPKTTTVLSTYEQNAVSTWANGNAVLVKVATPFVTTGPMYDSSTFYFSNVFLPITFSESTMQSAANNVSTQTIRQYWS